MSEYKITTALCDWIMTAGGTPTEEDRESITHAMRTLYYALGGEGEIPAEYANNIASLIQGLSYVAGGGGGASANPVGIHLVNNNTGTVQQKSCTINFLNVVDGVIAYDNNYAKPQNTIDVTTVATRYAYKGAVGDYDVVLFRLNFSLGAISTVTVTSSSGANITTIATADESNARHVAVSYPAEVPADEVLTVTVV